MKNRDMPLPPQDFKEDNNKEHSRISKEQPLINALINKLNPMPNHHEHKLNCKENPIASKRGYNDCTCPPSSEDTGKHTHIMKSSNGDIEFQCPYVNCEYEKKDSKTEMLKEILAIIKDEMSFDVKGKDKFSKAASAADNNIIKRIQKYADDKGLSLNN